MFKDFIKEQAGIQFYPVISLVTFIIFFIALSVRAMMYNKKELQEMSSIPLEDDATDYDI
jgi:cytochrome c oxidase cbb3-type subunit IV